MKTYVYVAGPINSSGFQNQNVRRACLVGEDLRQRGLVPFIPHLNVVWDTICPGVGEEEWLAWDFAWLEKCDALYRLKGHSRGADREEAFAKDAGIPIFYEEDAAGMKDLVAFAREREGQTS